MTRLQTATAIWHTTQGRAHSIRFHAVMAYCKVATPDPDAGWALCLEAIGGAIATITLVRFAAEHGYW